MAITYKNVAKRAGKDADIRRILREAQIKLDALFFEVRPKLLKIDGVSKEEANRICNPLCINLLQEYIDDK